MIKSESTALKIDKTCPLPEVPRVHRIVPDKLLDPAETEDVVTEPRQKQPRVCGNCGLPGHKRQSCQCNYTYRSVLESIV